MVAVMSSEGKVFTSLTDGVHYAEDVGFDTIVKRGRRAAERLPNDIVYAGFSLGVLPAQMLAQMRSGTKGALLFHSCVPPSEFGRLWPQGVPARKSRIACSPCWHAVTPTT
jgi:hypothetical protein